MKEKWHLGKEVAWRGPRQMQVQSSRGRRGDLLGRQAGRRDYVMCSGGKNRGESGQERAHFYLHGTPVFLSEGEVSRPPEQVFRGC